MLVRRTLLPRPLPARARSAASDGAGLRLWLSQAIAVALAAGGGRRVFAVVVGVEAVKPHEAHVARVDQLILVAPQLLDLLAQLLVQQVLVL